jgi:serine/threonine protein kinase
VLISHDGRALITGFDSSSELQDSELSSVRYSAPETLEEDDEHPIMASDIWSLGCIIYEVSFLLSLTSQAHLLQVLSRKVPFYQIRRGTKVAAAIAGGKKPVRTSQEENGVEEIRDAIWGPVSSCWEFEAKDRPSCLQFQKVFLSLVIRDDRPVPELAIQPEVFEHKKASAPNLYLARSILMQITGSDLSMPPPSKIPEHLQKPLFGLIDNRVKAEAVAVAAKKLSRDDTQILVDVLDLVSLALSLIAIEMPHPIF